MLSEVSFFVLKPFANCFNRSLTRFNDLFLFIEGFSLLILGSTRFTFSLASRFPISCGFFSNISLVSPTFAFHFTLPLIDSFINVFIPSSLVAEKIDKLSFSSLVRFPISTGSVSCVCLNNTLCFHVVCGIASVLILARLEQLPVCELAITRLQFLLFTDSLG
uniref:Uncharacterized protein n=1 Tax=Cacopsylla melanoneura TaxID=428564 RepID=A0A8D8R604_9HEMI